MVRANLAIVSRKNSDLLYFSALLLVAVFAIPAIAGPCLALDSCPVPVASDCHGEESEQRDCCCGVTATAEATRETIKHKASAWLLESPQMIGAVGNEISAFRAAFEPLPPPFQGEPLFVFHSSYLI